MRLWQPLLLTLLAAATAAVAPLSGVAQEAGVPTIGLLEVVRESLARNPDIKMAETDVLEMIGTLREIRGRFDTTVEAAVGQDFSATPATAADGGALDRELLSVYSVGARKLLPSGVTVSPTISIERSDGLRSSEPSSNRTALTLAVTLPMMQGKGEEVTRAAERASEQNLEGRRLVLVQKAASSISAVVAAYWDYLAARRHEEISRRSEEVAGQLLETVRMLVEADERPRVDLVPLRASLTSRQSSRLWDAREVVRARHALAVAMGLGPEEIVRLGEPSTNFPPLERDELPGPDGERVLMAQVGERRADLQALDREAEGIRIGLAAARDLIRPKLDVSVAAGFEALAEGGPVNAFLFPSGKDGVGPRLSVAVSYSWPVKGNGAKGLILQREAAYERALLEREERLRQIGLAVSAAMADLRANARMLETIQVATEYHLESVRVEEQKLRMGLTTIMDLISIEDDYFATLRERVDAQAAFAASIIALRLASGTIIAPGEGEQSLTLNNLNAVP